MVRSRIVASLLLISITYTTPAIAVLSADDYLRITMQMKELSRASQQGQLLQDSQIIRPSPKEREAISQLLATKPRPKTLNDADIKYLKDLLDKTIWFGFEQRIMHEIWTEVSGKEWHPGEGTHPLKNESSP